MQNIINHFPVLSLMAETGEAQEILLVEDDPEACVLLSKMLTLLGYRVIATGSAEEAVEKLAMGAQFSALVTDVNLPGASGIELAKHVYQMDRTVRIIFTTGMGYLLAPPLPFPFSLVSKPINLTNLQDIMRMPLGEKTDFTTGFSLQSILSKFRT
jgi:CheY-like chemotaxis protein